MCSPDPRQTGHYVIEKRIVPTEAGSDQNDENTDDRSSWQLVPLALSIMLGGNSQLRAAAFQTRIITYCLLFTVYLVLKNTKITKYGAGQNCVHLH